MVVKERLITQNKETTKTQTCLNYGVKDRKRQYHFIPLYVILHEQ